MVFSLVLARDNYCLWPLVLRQSATPKAQISFNSSENAFIFVSNTWVRWHEARIGRWDTDMLPSLGAAGTLPGRVSHFDERTSHSLPLPFSVNSGPHCLVISGFSGRSPVRSCHMLDFTQTGFGNSPMTLSQSPLKPDYPNQLSCLLKENLALESVFYKGTNHRTKKSAYFFSEQTWLVRQKGFQSYYRISLELSKPSKKLWALAQKGLAVRVAALVKLVSWRFLLQLECVGWSVGLGRRNHQLKVCYFLLWKLR